MLADESLQLRCQLYGQVSSPKAIDLQGWAASNFKILVPYRPLAAALWQTPATRAYYAR